MSCNPSLFCTIATLYYVINYNLGRSLNILGFGFDKPELLSQDYGG